MKPVVKICGVRRLADVAAARGADYVGLNRVTGRRRCVDPSTARAIVQALDGITPVGVYLDAAVDVVARDAAAIGLTHVQLHGAETPADCATLAERFRVIKALSVDEIERAEDYAPHVVALLIDGRSPGSGRRWDLDRLAPRVRHGRLAGRPVWLAGGLNADNVAEAIAVIGPAGVDTASGAERDGRIDAERVAAFVAAARAHSLPVSSHSPTPELHP